MTNDQGLFLFGFLLLFRRPFAANHFGLGLFGDGSLRRRRRNGRLVDLRRSSMKLRYKVVLGVAAVGLASAASFPNEFGLSSTTWRQREALSLYRNAGYRLVREEVAVASSNRTVGAGIRRYYFTKAL